MIEFKIEIEDYDKIQDDDFKKGTDLGLKLAAKFIQDEARDNHRYQSRTGNLRAATIARSYSGKVQAMINDAKAKYGKYVHSGQRSWPPDPFIDNAINNNLDHIDELIMAGIDKILGI